MRVREILAVLLTLAWAGADASRASIVWNLPAGGSWNTAADWNPATVPNAVGANATFNGAATANNPAQTGNRTVTADAAQTVGSIVFNTDLSTFTNSVTTGTSGSLTFDEVGAGPATINVPAAPGTGNNTISAAITLNDNLVAQVDNITASSAAGALNLTATIAGAGGFTKNGDGLATFGTGTKTYTGATVLNGGRMRVSSAASPTATSSFTINAGAQLDTITAATYTFGSGPLNLNGAGPTSGPFAAFPGAIRPDTNLAVGITNNVVLQSNSVIHVQGTSGSVTLSGGVSGPGKLIAGAIPHDANLGQVILTGSNSYTGGTEVQAGALVAGTASVNAFATANVTVDSANLAFAGSAADVVIQSGAVNAIADTATLSLAGGNVAGVADDGFASLAAGVNESVGGLILGGVTQTNPGTYGSTTSGASFQSDEFFSGTGVITLVPEPAGLGLFGLAGLVLRRRHRRHH